MALLTYADRVAETTTTTGTGTIQLGGAVDGKFRTFVAGAGSGNTVPYVIVHRTANEWEVGYGVVTSGSPDTLTRAGVYSSSNGGSAVNFSAGTKDVFLGLPAGKTITFNADGTQMTIPLGSAPAPSLAFSGDLNTGLWSPAADTLAVAVGGSEVARAVATGVQAVGSLAVGNATPASGAGITFPATQSASTDANTLDDYEEGTFTPTAVCTGQTITYAVRYGNYTKIGNLVRVTIALVLNTVSGAAGGATTITGLPFANGGPFYSGQAMFGYNDALTNPIESAWVNGTTVFFRTGDRSQTNDAGGFTAGGYLNLEILYRV